MDSRRVTKRSTRQKKRRQLPSVPSFVEKKITAFQSAVYDLIKNVPQGKVTTYGAICRALGRGSPRSIGNALRANPYAPVVPCHRVVRSDLSLGGFNGKTDPHSDDIKRKISLLRNEGVDIDDSHNIVKIARSSLFQFS